LLVGQGDASSHDAAAAAAAGAPARECLEVERFRVQLPELLLVGVGDDAADLPMLAPFLPNGRGEDCCLMRRCCMSCILV